MQQELFIKMVLDAWYAHLKYTNDVLSQVTDEQLMQQVSPGRNRGVYLLGHLAAVHDRMLRLLDMGEEINPALFEVFVEAPDKADAQYPPVSELRTYWNNVNAKLNEQFGRLSADEWFQKHTSVSEEDFKKEPHRNRLNIVISRTNHLASHYGQLVLMKPKS